MDDNLVEEYIALSVKYGELQVKGDYKKFNKIAERLSQIRQILRVKDNFVELFKPLLNHENDYVRMNTAYALLPFLSSEAEKVLEDISTRPRTLGFEAKMTLQEWRKGNLKFNW